MHRIALVLLASLGVAPDCMAQDVARMEQVVQSYVGNKTFAGSVLVARGTDVIVSKGYGLANVEWNIPASPNTRFKVASITKQFTAAITLAPSVLARYAGVYQFANGQTMTVKAEGGQLALHPTGGNALPFQAESETRFFMRDINLVIEFVRDAAGNVTGFALLQGTRQERATRVK